MPRSNRPALRDIARSIRKQDLEMIFKAGAGHIGGELSCIDILTALYFEVLNYDPQNPKDPNRDRFILSKGHSAAALYVTLSNAGFFDARELSTFLQPNSRLSGHPDCTKVPGVETNTGPLGHGLPVGVGSAIAAKLSQQSRKIYVLCGDGELQEGSNWEAAMSAAHYRLDNLILIVDRNRLQQGAGTEETNALEPLADKWLAFGWSVEQIDGHQTKLIGDTLRHAPFSTGKPTCVIANTNKGQGISFMQDNVTWHHKVPNEQQYQQAMTDLQDKSS